MHCSRRACSPILRQFSLEPLRPWLRVPSQPITSLPGSLPANDRLVRSDWRVALDSRGGVSGTGAALCWPGKGTTDNLAGLTFFFFFFFSLPFPFFFFLLPKRGGFLIITICVLIPRPFLGQGDGKESRRKYQGRDRNQESRYGKDRKQDIGSGLKKRP